MTRVYFNLTQGVFVLIDVRLLSLTNVGHIRGKMREYTEKIEARINKDSHKAIEILVRNGSFKNYSDFLRAAIESELDRQTTFKVRGENPHTGQSEAFTPHIGTQKKTVDLQTEPDLATPPVHPLRCSCEECCEKEDPTEQDYIKEAKQIADSFEE